MLIVCAGFYSSYMIRLWKGTRLEECLRYPQTGKIICCGVLQFPPELPCASYYVSNNLSHETRHRNTYFGVRIIWFSNSFYRDILWGKHFSKQSSWTVHSGQNSASYPWRHDRCFKTGQDEYGFWLLTFLGGQGLSTGLNSFLTLALIRRKVRQTSQPLRLITALYETKTSWDSLYK
jgi:hypothetical protein